jgi:hypothetical protein
MTRVGILRLGLMPSCGKRYKQRIAVAKIKENAKTTSCASKPMRRCFDVMSPCRRGRCSNRKKGQSFNFRPRTNFVMLSENQMMAFALGDG